MRIKRGYSNRFKIGFFVGVGLNIYIEGYHPEWMRYLKNHYIDNYWWALDYDDFKRREQWRWNQYLKKWDPYDKGGWNEAMGNLSSTVVDKIVFGEKRWQDPPSYDHEANEFIALAESSGVDPALPLYTAIKKVVDAYYPLDLDENPEETKQVIEPQIQWTHSTNMDAIVEENEKKPKPNSLARYLWSIPGFQDFYETLRADAREVEESIVTSLNRDERLVWYERMDELTKRWGQELNDYAPLLAYRWDRKLKFAQYVMRPRTPDEDEELVNILNQPGGIKQLFIKAGVITPDYDDYQTN